MLLLGVHAVRPYVSWVLEKNADYLEGHFGSNVQYQSIYLTEAPETAYTPYYQASPLWIKIQSTTSVRSYS